MLISAKGVGHVYRSIGAGGLKTSRRVLEGVDISIGSGEVVGLLGASGSGKTTLGRILTGLVRPTEGAVYLDGDQVQAPYRGQVRRRVQILFQHPESAFDPRMTIHASLREVYRIYGKPFDDYDLLGMLEPFGVYREHLGRMPAQLSGGELQRIALARVLLVRPEFIVLDEPTSMLDGISQAQVMRMLMEVRERLGIAYLFITHDRQLCDFVSDRVLEIQEGRIKA